MVQKADVEISKGDANQLREAMDEALKRMEKKVEPPPISETLEKAKLALAQAQKVKASVKRIWYCTDCGRPHIQNDGMDMGLGHISVDVIDGEFVDAESGQLLTGKPKTLMEKYAVPKVEQGDSHCQGTNAATLAKMKELK